MEELLRRQPPSRRAQLEIQLEEAQRDPLYRTLGLSHLKVGKRMPNEVIEHILALYGELKRSRTKPTASPEEARKANAELRRQMHERGNHFADIERVASQTLDSVGYRRGAVSQGLLMTLVGHFGFSLQYVQDLPRSVRSVTDLRNRRIYLEREQLGMHTPRTILLQTLGHIALDHDQPRDFADFLRQRVEANYFGAAILMPERSVVPFLQEAKLARELSVEDLADVFSVSYEMAAHRFTNMATHHLGLQLHFTKNDENGTIYKAYANDGLAFPQDEDGAIEGQRMCREWGFQARVRRRGPLLRLLPVHRHPQGDVLVPVAHRPQPRARLRDHARRPVRGLALVPRPGDDPAGQVGLPGRRLLPASPQGAVGPLGGHGLAVGARALARPVRPAARRVPRRGRRRRLRVPRQARRR